MKKLFLLSMLISGLAFAAPPAAKPTFQAKFSRPHKTLQETLGTAYGWEGKDRVLEGELVYEMVGKKRKSLDALAAFSRKSLLNKMVISEEKPFMMGSHRGIQVTGINENGVPFAFRMISLPTRSYVYGAVTYDTAHNRDFVESFRILP